MLKLLLAAAWIVYGPSGPIARTIVTTDDCPSITIDGASSKMRVHSTKAAAYPVTVCEAALRAHVRSAAIGDTLLPVAKLQRSEKVAILGDTGCRMQAATSKYPARVQDCNDPVKWPFRQVADTIAKWDPDLILHVGDYYYREAACTSPTKCVKAPYTWNRWNADFFTPASTLLPNAPWVMVRGNHESCPRAAEGWFRFLETRNYVWEDVKTCTSNLSYTPPYTLDIGGLSIAVLDSSNAADSLDTSQVPIFANELAHIAKTKPGTWLTLHHPFWADSYGDEDSETMAAAWQNTPVPSLGLVVSGHIHDLEILGFTGNQIPQLVVGNGGTATDPSIADPTGTVLDGRTVASFYQDDDFGFIAATRAGDVWTFDIRSTSGQSKAKCTWSAGAAMACAPTSQP